MGRGNNTRPMVKGDLTMRNAVIGQTGKVVLSDDAIHRKLSRKQTVRYQYQKVQYGFMAWVCGPFHSRLYGIIGFGVSRVHSKAALQRRLANDYGYLGNMLFSDVDEADTVGDIDPRLSDVGAAASPVTCSI